MVPPCRKGRGPSSARSAGGRFALPFSITSPRPTALPLKPKFAAFPWKYAQRPLKAWQRGLTGYPIVDAGMRQLWRTGWMHNRVRMIVGSFLTKDLLQSWQAGAEWFWDTLVDADLANNTLGWQWISGLRRGTPLLLPHLQSHHAGEKVRSGGELHSPVGAGTGPARRRTSYSRALDRRPEVLGEAGRRSGRDLSRADGRPCRCPRGGPPGSGENEGSELIRAFETAFPVSRSAAARSNRRRQDFITSSLPDKLTHRK